MKYHLKIFIFGIFLLTPFFSLFASELVQDKQEILKARVLQIQEAGVKELPGISKQIEYQILQVEVLDEIDQGKVLTIENDYITLKKGQKFYLLKSTSFDSGKVTYFVSDVYRMNWIIFFIVLFVVLVIVYGGIHGIRGLLSLAGGLLLIFYLLLPKIVAGFSPLLIGCIVASLISIVGSYITHGFNRTTTSAVFGMVSTVIFTGLLAYFAVEVSSLSGMESEEAMYLSLNSRGAINLQGLLLSGIMIGLLGVLYDSAIGQAISVEELWRADPKLSRSYVFKRSLRIGREHIGALVNTLALAYVGAALPLLVLFSFPAYGSVSSLVNREIFATEIIRTMIGSIGLVLAVPITTFISVWMLHGVKFKGHTHEHSHSHNHSH